MLDSDNQQATTGWFVGILEGEGNFYHYGNNYQRVEIANTNTCIIEACESFLRRNSVLYNTCKNNKKTRGGKWIYKIHVSGTDCYNLYKIVEHKLQCRRDQFQQLVGAPTTERDATLDKDWLIGIWQAEGTFSIGTNYLNEYKPNISLPNTNQKIIKKIVINLKELGCSWHVKDFKPEINKPYTRITIGGMMRCQRFLRATKGLWIGKRDIARTSLLQEYINSRLSKEQRTPYNEREHEIYHQLGQLNV